MNKNILIIAAHSDDQTLGTAGTAAKYAKEGFEVRTVIFSWGEVSYPHFKENVIVNTRERESLRADKIIGGKGVNFLKVPEKKIKNEVEIFKAKKKLERIIRNLRPVKVFTHSQQDPHPVHRVTSQVTLEVIDSLPWKTEVYTFDIWNPFRFSFDKHPKLFIDTSDTFELKIKALKCFKSQFSLHGLLNFLPLISTYVKNFIDGKKINKKYAEVFRRIR
ncbi:PIG-L family deacetylase [archaeon]|nr:PIG-L family deacetylase [archaeon]MBL7056902.1 PIG-L family deacetylase [Candidatus Woesearchaeota archaeon]